MPSAAMAIEARTATSAGATTAASADAAIAAVASGPEVTIRNDVPVSTTATISRARVIWAPAAPIASRPNGRAATPSTAARWTVQSSCDLRHVTAAAIARAAMPAPAHASTGASSGSAPAVTTAAAHATGSSRAGARTWLRTATVVTAAARPTR